MFPSLESAGDALRSSKMDGPYSIVHKDVTYLKTHRFEDQININEVLEFFVPLSHHQEQKHTRTHS